MSKKKFVLILDPNSSKSLILQKRLQGFGYEVEMVSNVDSLIEQITRAEAPPDLVLVDVTASSLDLLNVPMIIKQVTDWGSFIPIAVHSAVAEKEIILKAIQSGFADYIIRPIENEIFQDRINKLVNRTPELNQTTFRKPLFEVGHLDLELNILNYNEFGCTAECMIPLPIDKQFALQNPTFEKILEGKVQVRVVSCGKNDSGKFEHVLSYVGLDAQQTRLLRQSVLTQVKPKEKKAA